MSFLKESQIKEINDNLVVDEQELKKIYKVKKDKYIKLSVMHSLVDDYIKDGWEEERQYKTKTKLKKKKNHSMEFEHDIWCQFYELGYRILNRDENFILPFSKDPKEKKQIDVIAISNETIFIIECKSSLNQRKASSYKDDFELLKLRINGFKKVLSQIYKKDIKIKYIFATRNIRLSSDSEDFKRLKDARAFYYNDTTYKYVNMLIKNYKKASIYQFLGLVFKNEKINKDYIEIPAIEGRMGEGKNKYYMFSIEPSLLLKIGFILHRTKANEDETPTYQRLLVPSRLKGITEFIDNGGYFPNSLILNFNNRKVRFESSSKTSNTSSKFGTLKIPNEYAIAYILDGQHRLYGYANSKYKNSNTIPVVALVGLSPTQQLEIFVDINENQKAVSPSLRLVLEEDLYWDSEQAVSRLKALRSSIIKTLSESDLSPLSNKIAIGEDASILTFKPFTTALNRSGLLPTAKGNKYDESSLLSSLYDISNSNHHEEMNKTKKRVIELLNNCYGFVEENYSEIFNKEKYFIVSNRGTYAFIMFIGSINSFLIEKRIISKTTNIEERFNEMKKYLKVLLEGIVGLSKEEEEKQLLLRGAGADTAWLRLFESIVHDKFNDFEPLDLIKWRERQDKTLQSEAIKYKEKIEKKMKSLVLEKIKTLYGQHWELEINSIKRKCQERAEEEKEKNYKEGIPVKDVHWTEMFNINDYKTIIQKYWTRKPEKNTLSFKTFEEEFSIDIGEGFNSKNEKTKWISSFNTYRNTLAHQGTKENGLSKDEVFLLEKVHKHFYVSN